MSIETTMRLLARTGMILVMATAPGAAVLANAAAPSTTHTTLTAETREAGGHTVAIFTTQVLSEDGTPAAGTVTLVDGRQAAAAAALDADGKAEIRLESLTAGDHAVRAVYDGTGVNGASQSERVVVHPQATTNPDFTLGLAPASLTQKAGTAGALVVTITPTNGFTGFISLSCSGTGQTTNLPFGVTCIFSPVNLQVLAPTAANPNGIAVANLTLQTTSPAGKNALLNNPTPFVNRGNHGPLVRPLALAILIPGAFGLAWLGRRRKLLGQATLLLMLGACAVLSTSACSARYGYFHHPPTYNGGTPTGSYTITVTAQTSNGVTATAHSTSLALTVN